MVLYSHETRQGSGFYQNIILIFATHHFDVWLFCVTTSRAAGRAQDVSGELAHRHISECGQICGDSRRSEKVEDFRTCLGE